jgi:hypothetical protein
MRASQATFQAIWYAKQTRESNPPYLNIAEVFARPVGIDLPLKKIRQRDKGLKILRCEARRFDSSSRHE